MAPPRVHRGRFRTCGAARRRPHGSGAWSTWCRTARSRPASCTARRASARGAAWSRRRRPPPLRTRAADCQPLQDFRDAPLDSNGLLRGPLLRFWDSEDSLRWWICWQRGNDSLHVNMQAMEVRKDARNSHHQTAGRRPAEGTQSSSHHSSDELPRGSRAWLKQLRVEPGGVGATHFSE